MAPNGGPRIIRIGRIDTGKIRADPFDPPTSGLFFGAQWFIQVVELDPDSQL